MIAFNRKKYHVHYRCTPELNSDTEETTHSKTPSINPNCLPIFHLSSPSFSPCQSCIPREVAASLKPLPSPVVVTCEQPCANTVQFVSDGQRKPIHAILLVLCAYTRTEVGFPQLSAGLLTDRGRARLWLLAELPCGRSSGLGVSPFSVRVFPSRLRALGSWARLGFFPEMTSDWAYGRGGESIAFPGVILLPLLPLRPPPLIPLFPCWSLQAQGLLLHGSTCARLKRAQ